MPTVDLDTTTKPKGALTQFDPGIFKDEAGGYFASQPGGGYAYGGTDPSVFGIGTGPKAPEPAKLPTAPPDWPAPVINTNPAPSTPAPSVSTPAPSGDPFSWINDALSAAQSTDDPAYWREKIGADPNGNGSAKAYWLDRIARGDGALAVRQGTMAKYGATSPSGGSVASASSGGSQYTPGQSYASVPGISQFDPGIFTDGQGHFFVPGGNGYIYAADNPSAFGIGGKPAGAAFLGSGANSTAGRGGVPGVPVDANAAYPGNLFNDPGTQLLEDTIKARLNELFAPVNDPALAQLNKLITDNLDRLNNPNDPSWKAISDILSKRISDLQAPVYTSQQEEAVKTRLFDQQEQDRQSEIQSAIERLAGHGVGRSSGVIASATDLVNKRYDAARANTQNTFATDTIAEQQRRADEAMQVAGALFDAQQGRVGQAINLGGSLYDLSTGVMDQETARRREALSLISTLSDIPGQRLQLAEQAAGMTVSPSSISDQILKLMTNSQTQTENAANRRSNLVSGIGQIVGSILAGSFGAKKAAA